MATNSYRPDIDWLRAVAVLIVVGFHFEISGFRGGFVGVDVFFVVSGFLIGRIVQSELLAGTFSFTHFYERRIRRLLPALYVMLIVVAATGSSILFGSERSEFVRSIGAVATFTSNILFWTQSGYFDRAASEKPLLHTWSLGIEEQFYLLLPILLWAAWRIRSDAAVKIIVVAIAALSFWMSCSLVSSERAGAFFLIQSRAWELLLGVMLVWMPTPRSLWIGHVARTFVLVLIIVAVLAFPAGLPFPGVNALLPCAGAALFICGGASTWRMPPIELIGRMSYSIYLWHWPVYTLAKMHTLSLTLTIADKFWLMCLLAVVSFASYRLIESPGRTARAEPKTVFAYAGLATAVLLLIALSGASLSPVAADSDQVAALKLYDGLTGMERTGYCFTEDWNQSNHPECFAHDDRTPSVLVWGDSLADHYMPGLREAAGLEFQILQATAAGCFPTTSTLLKQFWFCDNLSTRVIQFVAKHPPGILVISADWVGYSMRAGLEAMIADLKATIEQVGARWFSSARQSNSRGASRVC